MKNKPENEDPPGGDESGRVWKNRRRRRGMRADDGLNARHPLVNEFTEKVQPAANQFE
jgi:hypothetical protein